MNVAVPGRPTGPRDAVEAGSGAGGPHARTVTLPPSAEAPRATRRFLLGELTGDDARAARKAGGESADLDEDVIDTILLLATELVTNAVLHAGTAIVVALECGDHQITVRVIDRHPGPVAVRPAPTGDAALSENGRGLELVAALAASWGTEHTPNGKTVWFRLETAPTASLPPPLPPPASPADAQPAAAARGTIGGPPRLLSADLLAVLSAEDEIGELAARLVDAVGLDGAAVRRTLGAPDEVIVVATVGPTGDPSRARITPLDAPGQRLGELLLWPRDPVLDDEGRARVRLTARWMALALRGADLRRAEERRIGMLSFLAET
ncbi:MAG: ATP-binding protein, partial [Frankia sp.]